MGGDGGRTAEKLKTERLKGGKRKGRLTAKYAKEREDGFFNRRLLRWSQMLLSESETRNAKPGTRNDP